MPVGLIDNAWGGSAAEAWVRRDIAREGSALQDADGSDRQARKPTLQSEKAKADYEAALAKWKADARKREGRRSKAAPPRSRNRRSSGSAGNARPGNIFAGVRAPDARLRHQGRDLVSGRKQRRPRLRIRASSFPFMIEQWRKEWKQGDFPFYWVQLADFIAGEAEPGDSDWAELREVADQDA